ncbi:hypothetical protein DV736_g82, partial [Chaetothyriales sp. CBS 134916]
MVKLRVTARVLTEDSYNHSILTQTSTPRSSRKFLVIVRDPDESYFIGNLAVDIQSQYRRLYKHDLGKIKYLKDNNDNDLDPEQLVLDVFVNEGKAERDGLDQDATISVVVQDQQQAVRLGSVVPDLTPIHYHSRPRPRTAVPRFEAVTPTLGKRPRADLAIQETPRNDKRLRQIEATHSLEDAELVPSIERSPELVVHDTQPSNVRSDTAIDADGRVVTAGSLQLPRHHNLAPSRNASNVNGTIHAAEESWTPPTPPLRRSRLPTTPPPNSAPPIPPMAPDNHGSKSPARQLVSTSGTKFKKPSRANAFDLPHGSEIEDSQMPKPDEPVPQPRLVRNTGKVLGKSHPQINDNAAQPIDVDKDTLEDKSKQAPSEDDSDGDADVAFTSAKASSALSDKSDNTSSTGTELVSDDGDKAARPSEPPKHAIQDDKSDKHDTRPAPSLKKPQGPPDESTSDFGSATTNEDTSDDDEEPLPAEPKMIQKYISTARKDNDKETDGPSMSNRKPGTGPVAKLTNTSADSSKSGLDSPGAQLSQALQESAVIDSLPETIQASGSAITPGNKDTERRDSSSSSSTTTSSSSKRDGIGLGITDSPRKRRSFSESPGNGKVPFEERLEQMRRSSSVSVSLATRPVLDKPAVPSIPAQAGEKQSPPSKGQSQHKPSKTEAGASVQQPPKPEQKVVGAVAPAQTKSQGLLTASSNEPILPAGMSLKEYEAMKSRMSMTEEQRRNLNKQRQKASHVGKKGQDTEQKKARASESKETPAISPPVENGSEVNAAVRAIKGKKDIGRKGVSSDRASIPPRPLKPRVQKQPAPSHSAPVSGSDKTGSNGSAVNALLSTSKQLLSASDTPLPQPDKSKQSTRPSLAKPSTTTPKGPTTVRASTTASKQPMSIRELKAQMRQDRVSQNSSPALRQKPVVSRAMQINIDDSSESESDSESDSYDDKVASQNRSLGGVGIDRTIRDPLPDESDDSD